MSGLPRRTTAIVVALVAVVAAGTAVLLLLEGRARLRPDEIERQLADAASAERAGDLTTATRTYERCLRAARDLEAGKLVSRSANGLAAVEQKQGHLDSARAHAEEALEAASRARSEVERAAALYTLGYVQYSLGRMREAIRYFGESTESASRAGDPGFEAKAQLQVGITATMMEQRAVALPALERVIALAHARGDAGEEARAVRVLGELHSRLGETDAAIADYERARKILAPVGDLSTEAVLANAMGQVYFDMDEKETALRYYLEGLTLNERLGLARRAAATKLEIGRCHLDLGRAGKALPYLEEALASFRELGNQRLEADVLTQLGRLHAGLAEDDAARRSFEQALSLKIADSDPRERADTLREAAAYYEHRGDLDRSRGYLEEALSLSRKGSDPAGESLTLYRLAALERDAGDLPRARSHIEGSVALVESLRANVASHALRTSFFASAYDRYALYVDVLLGLDREQPGRGFQALAFTTAERARARTFLDSLGEARASIRSGIDPGLLADERALRARLDEAASEQLLLPKDVDRQTADSLSREIDSLIDEHDRLEATIRTRSPRYAALTQPHAASLDEVQSDLLDDDTTLLSYTLGPARSFLWTISRHRTEVHELPARDEIEALARDARRALQAPGAFRKDGLDGSPLVRLSRLLLGPVTGLRERPRLAIVADGALGFVPFGALPLPEADSSEVTPLAAVSEIVRLPSISILPELRAQSRGRHFTKWVAVAADPVYGPSDPRLPATPARGEVASSRASAIRWKRLPSSGKEAAAIARAAPRGSVVVVTGLEATRRWATSFDFDGFRAVHFATHAILDDDRPTLSGIVLSLVDGKGEPQDGVLRLDDIYNLSLPTGLVVLSACETALGKNVRGEGLLSIVRGFLYAGATSVVASSWKVDDEATAALMDRFYRGLFSGETPATALRDAELWMARTERFRDPYYWAAFELQGDWRWDRGPAETGGS